MTGLDITPAMVKAAQTNGEIVELDIAREEGDATGLPFAETASN